jgi:ribonuclease HI
MEIFGLYRGLQEIYKDASKGEYSSPMDRRILVISDSKYVLDGAKAFVRNWVKNGWKTAAGEPVKNQDLWERVFKGLELLEELGFKFEYELVKGHSGSEANERVDQIAVKFSKAEPISLYEGPVSGYSVSLDPGSTFEPLYLSYVSGKLQRHKTWEECKRATDGKAGARYKKVKNRMEEQETLKSWGLA